MNKNKKSILSRMALCAVSMSMLMTAGCGKSNNSSNGTIYVIAKQPISFWDDVKSGAEDAGKELGYEIVYKVASSDNDFASQIEYINDAIKNNADAIIVAPNSNKELDDVFKKADDAGIKIINMNSRTDYEGVATCVAASESDGGAVAARYTATYLMSDERVTAEMQNFAGEDMTKALKASQGSIAIIGHTASTAEERVSSFKTTAMDYMGQALEQVGMTFEQMGKQTTDQELEAMYANFFIEGERCGTVDAAYDEALKLLGKDGKNVKVFYTTNTSTTLGAAKAIEELGLADSIYLVGFNTDQEELAYLKTGVIDGLVYQNPYSIGYIAVSYTERILDGSGVPKNVNTGATFITADNMNDDNIKALLDPASIG